LHRNKDFKDHFSRIRDIRNQVFKKDFREFKGSSGSLAKGQMDGQQSDELTNKCRNVAYYNRKQ